MEALFAYVAMPMWQNFAEKKNGYEGIDVTGLEITSICCQGTIQHIFFPLQIIFSLQIIVLTIKGVKDLQFTGYGNLVWAFMDLDSYSLIDRGPKWSLF